MARRLILFDIDGTLIATNYSGRQVMSQALKSVFGTDGSLKNISFAGKTDLGIIRSAMAPEWLSESELIAQLPRVLEAMASIGEQTFLHDNLVPCPGVRLLLDRLQQYQGVLLGLQTGNIRATAIQKLIAAGLDPAWFAVGAYGSDSATREELFPLAWRRTRQLTGYSFSGHNTIAVGDTPGDVDAARANGIASLAVASGFCSALELASREPDYLLPDLSETEAVLDILTNFDKR